MNKLLFKALPLVLIAVMFLQTAALSYRISAESADKDPAATEYSVREGDNTSYHGENDIIMGLEGTYATVDEAAKQTILNRLNEIRKEACDNGYPHPNDRSVKLTPDDYVPIRWSHVVELIAAMRAVEASVCIGHRRLSADEGSAFFNGYGFLTRSEVLAWNWSSADVNGILYGIEQFYYEKNDWLNNTPGAVTGHYTAMILPSHTHIGIAGFESKYAAFRISVAAQFATERDIDETAAGVGGKVYQKVKVDRSLVTQLTLSCKDIISPGETVSALAVADIEKHGDYTSAGHGPVFEGLSWKSSDPSVLSVDEKGTVKGQKDGKATLTAYVDDKTYASAVITVENTEVHSAVYHEAELPTHYAPGNKEYWECKNCGKLFSDPDCKIEISGIDVVIPIIPHDLIWVRSASGHKQVCECGYETKMQSHVVAEGGAVCVICGYDGSTAPKGDINNDGDENNKDVIVLFRYVSSGGTDLKYDFSGDGEINNKDVVSLFRYISS